MSELIDIHTHHTDGIPGGAIISVNPRHFVAQPGCWYSVGMHPWYIDKMTEEETTLVEKLASHPQVLAIGEAGFDRNRNFDHDLQMSVFMWQNSLSAFIDKPLIIHMVKSADLLLWANQFRKDTSWIIHGFRGKPELAKQLLDAGMYLSYGEHYNVDALRSTPLDRLFLETDEATCGIDHIYNKVATDLEMDCKALKVQVKKNIDCVFFKKK